MDRDPVLKDYVNRLHRETGLEFPNFDREANTEACILAIHQDPGGSGAVKTQECSIDNPDPSAKNLKNTLSKLGIDRTDVVFWNFYPAFDINFRKIDRTYKIFWAKKLHELVSLLPHLKVIIVSGNKAWDGMRFFRPKRNITLIASPHPSNRGMNSYGDARCDMEEAWDTARILSGIERK